MSHVKQKPICATPGSPTCYVGPEPEFFIFDEVRYEQNQHKGYYEIDSVEGAWNTARIEEPNLGYKPSFKGGYFPVSPTDTFHDLRSEMVDEMRQIGIIVEAHHHEVATAGQSEIDMQFQPLLKMADQFMWAKCICKNVAKRHGKTVTFMPKPIFEDNGSGMHTHISLWKGNTPLRWQPVRRIERAGTLRPVASRACAGDPRICGADDQFHYRRLVPGFEAPVNLALSARNRSAAIRIPMYSKSPKAKRLEFRCPDPSCNGYLAWSAMLMAMLDGIQNRIDPGQPLDRDIYEMTRDEMKHMGIRTTPGSLDEAINALEQDHAFLLRGDVFTDDLIRTWIAWKRERELDPMRLRPHPHSFISTTTTDTARSGDRQIRSLDDLLISRCRQRTEDVRRRRRVSRSESHGQERSAPTRPSWCPVRSLSGRA